MAGNEKHSKENITEELDKVIPKHQLLDNTAAKHKNELVHRGTLASRHLPSGQGRKGEKRLENRQKWAPPPPPPQPPKDIQEASNDSTESKPKLAFLADIKTAKKLKKTDDTNCDSKKSDTETVKNKSPSQKPKLSFLESIENAKNKQEVKDSEEFSSVKLLKKVNIKSKPVSIGKPSIQDQLRMKLEARKKLVDENDEGAENETAS